MDKDTARSKADKSLEKRRAIKELDKAVAELGLESESEWTFLELLAQEIEATYLTQQMRLTTTTLAKKRINGKLLFGINAAHLRFSLMRIEQEYSINYLKRSHKKVILKP